MSHNPRSFNYVNPETAHLLGMDRRDVERFWAKVDRSGPVPAHRPDLGPCWLWTSNRAGAMRYGQFGVVLPGAPRRQKNMYAHRIAWALSHGCGLPDHRVAEICHHCDVPHCVNPEHVYLGSRKTNMEDAAARGRLHTPRPKRQKLTVDDLAAIDGLLASGELQVTIARRFGVSTTWVCLYAKGVRRQYDRPARRGRPRTEEAA